MNKQNVINSYNGVLFGNKKGWITDTGNDMDGSQKLTISDKSQTWDCIS